MKTTPTAKWKVAITALCFWHELKKSRIIFFPEYFLRAKPACVMRGLRSGNVRGLVGRNEWLVALRKASYYNAVLFVFEVNSSRDTDIERFIPPQEVYDHCQSGERKRYDFKLRNNHMFNAASNDLRDEPADLEDDDAFREIIGLALVLDVLFGDGRPVNLA
ncbi:hypothetical protein CPC08DRAFT_791998, partial [Agrocybe pediades]